MPKRHRQPEPIDIVKAGSAAATTTALAVSASSGAKARGTGQRDEGTGDDVKRPTTGDSVASEAVFPATPSTLETDRKARLQALRAAKTALTDYGDISSSAEERSVNSQPASGEVDFDSSELGDDGNQEDDSVADILEEDSDQDGDYEAFMGRGRHGGAEQSESGSSSDLDEVSHSSDDDDDDDDDDEDEEEMSLDDDSDASSDDEESDEESGDGESSTEANRGGGNALGRTRLRRAARGASDDETDDDDLHHSDDLDDDDAESDDEGKQVTVDFGVYDMKPSHVDAIVHLMDQLCPDKMDEVNRDDLGAALAENPYTYVVKVNDAEEDDDSDDDDAKDGGESAEKDAAAEIYGLASALDVAHGVRTHPAAFKALYKLLQGEVWRSVAQGIPPADLLLSTTAETNTKESAGDDEDDEDGESAIKRSKREDGTASKESGLAKCLLLVSEYIRNVPIELTVQIFDDLVNRVEDDAKRRAAGGALAVAEGKSPDAVRATPGCMFAVLAKVQRMVDPPVTLTGSKKKSPSGEVEGEGARKAQAAGKKRAAAGGSEATKADDLLDLRRYAFWREEDNVMYDFRDKRVGTLSYKCRPQYEGQPEQDIPLSLLFVLQHGALRQAVAEMKRRATIAADVIRY